MPFFKRQYLLNKIIPLDKKRLRDKKTSSENAVLEDSMAISEEVFSYGTVRVMYLPAFMQTRTGRDRDSEAASTLLTQSV